MLFINFSFPCTLFTLLFIAACFSLALHLAIQFLYYFSLQVLYFFSLHFIGTHLAFNFSLANRYFVLLHDTIKGAHFGIMEWGKTRKQALGIYISPNWVEVRQLNNQGTFRPDIDMMQSIAYRFHCGSSSVSTVSASTNLFIPPECRRVFVASAKTQVMPSTLLQTSVCVPLDGSCLIHHNSATTTV